jgi:hypothetical protein
VHSIAQMEKIYFDPGLLQRGDHTFGLFERHGIVVRPVNDLKWWYIGLDMCNAESLLRQSSDNEPTEGLFSLALLLLCASPG